MMIYFYKTCETQVNCCYKLQDEKTYFGHLMNVKGVRSMRRKKNICEN